MDMKNIMCAYFNTNHFALDVMSAFEESSPESFFEYCKEKIREEYTLSEFLDKIDDYSHYGLDRNDEMLSIVKEIYQDSMSDKDIEKCWRKSGGFDRFVMKTDTENEYDLNAILDSLYGDVSPCDETYFAYDWGEGELVDEYNDDFFYHAEMFLNDNDEIDIVLQRWFESEAVTVELDADNKVLLLERMKKIAKEHSFSFEQDTKTKSDRTDNFKNI